MKPYSFFWHNVIMIAFLFLHANSCATKPPNVPVCEHLERVLIIEETTGHHVLKDSPTCVEKVGEAQCGHCVRIVTGEEFFIGENSNWFEGKPWSQIRGASVQVPANSYAEIATYMINACKKTGCDQDVTRFRVRLGKLRAAK